MSGVRRARTLYARRARMRAACMQSHKMHCFAYKCCFSGAARTLRAPGAPRAFQPRLCVGSPTLETRTFQFRYGAPLSICLKETNFHKGFDASPKFVVHSGRGMGQQKQSQQRMDSDALRSTGLELRRFAPFVEQMQGFCSSVLQVVRPFQL